MLTANQATESRGKTRTNSHSVTAISLYLQEIAKYPVLTASEEQELAKQLANGEPEAKEKFIKSNLRLVVSIAKKYQSDKFELLDLIQEGNLGLIKAVDMFDHTKGYKFSTYASYWIKQSILRSFANDGDFIRIPSHLLVQVNKYKALQSKFYHSNKRYANNKEIAEIMHISLQEVKELTSYIFEVISYNAPINQFDGAELGEFLPDLAPTPEQLFIDDSDKELLEFLITNSNLTPKEEQVIRMRYDLTLNEIKSLGSIARKLRISQERVRMIESKAFRKIRFTAARENISK